MSNLNNKLTTLAHLQTAMESAKGYIDQQDAALSGQIAGAISDIEALDAAALRGVKVNGNALAITDKMVDILIASGEENGTLSVNGAAIAITGLASLAYKSEITEAELGEALKASIAAKATQADLDALIVRVGNVELAGYQTAEQVQAAIAAANHLKYSIVDAAPSAEDADANTWYMVMNEETGHYDIYGLLDGEVRLIDDTTVDLTGYSTTEAMQTYVGQQIAALNVEQYATDEELQAVIIDIGAIQTALANVYTKAEIDAELAKKMNVADMGSYATDTEAAAEADAAEAAAKAHAEEKATAAETAAKAHADEAAAGALADAKTYADGAAADAVAAATATDEEVQNMVNSVFTPNT